MKKSIIVKQDGIRECGVASLLSIFLFETITFILSTPLLFLIIISFYYSGFATYFPRTI